MAHTAAAVRRGHARGFRVGSDAMTATVASAQRLPGEPVPCP